VLAVDLPGRRGRPGDLSAVTITDCTVPGVVAKLGPSRVLEMILAAAVHLVTEKVDRSELVSEPKRLAEILVERCRLYSR
jgi:hypothetical protein